MLLICITFVRDFLMGVHMLFLLHTLLMRCHALWAVTRFPSEMSWFFGPDEISRDFHTRYPDEMSCFWGPLRALRMIFPCFFGFRIIFLMVRCKDGGNYDGLLDVARFCVCKLVGGFVGGGMNVSWVVVVRCKCKCKCECVGRQKGFVWRLSDSCHQHALHQVDTYVCLRMT
jgi:hypothetical protein